MRVLSITRVLPSPDDRQAGLFVERRLAAMARITNLRVLQPVPYFPLVRPLPRWAHEQQVPGSVLSARPLPMFYLPRVLKSLDSFWLRRAVRAAVPTSFNAQLPDILDAHFGYPDGVAVTRVAADLKVPSVVTIRGVEQDYFERSPAVTRKLLAMFQQVTGCIAVSYSLRDAAVAAGAPCEKISVIHNAIDRHVFRPGDRTAARSALGLQPDATLLLAVGNLLSVKRHDVLLRAIAKLASFHPELSLAIAGGAAHEPDTPTSLRALVAELGLGERVRFLGRVGQQDIVRWLHAADAFCLASRREGCCNAILEALACGLPVAATDVGDNKYFVKNGQNGYLALPNNVDSLAAAIRDTLSSPEWDRDRISAGLHVGEWEDVARAVLGYFNDCRTRFHEESGTGASYA